MNTPNTERNELIIAMRENGCGPRSIARAIKCSPQTVSAVLFRAGKTNPTKQTGGRGYGYSPEEKSAALKLCETMSQRDVAKRIGASRQAVGRWLKDAK